jgi:hypothetical protein
MSDSEEFASASEGEEEQESQTKDEGQLSEPAQSPKQNSEEDKQQITQPENVQQSQTTQASGGGWGGWGSFLASAVSAVQETLKDDIDNMYNSAKGISENIMALDITGETETAVDNTKAEESSSTQQPKDTVKTDAILKSTETVLSAIDKTLDFTSDLLGNAVLGGYRQLEKANISEKIGDLEKSELFTQGKQVGHTLVANGLTALEAIGSVVGAKAAQALAEARGKQIQQQEQQEEDRKAGKKRKQKKDPTLEALFEDNCGNAHLQVFKFYSLSMF